MKEFTAFFKKRKKIFSILMAIALVASVSIPVLAGSKDFQDDPDFQEVFVEPGENVSSKAVVVNQPKPAITANSQYDLVSETGFWFIWNEEQSHSPGTVVIAKRFFEENKALTIIYKVMDVSYAFTFTAPGTYYVDILEMYDALGVSYNSNASQPLNWIGFVVQGKTTPDPEYGELRIVKEFVINDVIVPAEELPADFTFDAIFTVYDESGSYVTERTYAQLFEEGWNPIIDLPIGKYTVVETNSEGSQRYIPLVIDGSTEVTVIANAAVDAKITNTYKDKEDEPDLYSLTIDKEFLGVDKPDKGEWDAIFTVTGPDGEEVAVYNYADLPATLDNLALGAYTVTESDRLGINGYTFIDVSGEGEYQVIANETTEVTIINTYSEDPPPVEPVLGSLTVSKNWIHTIDGIEQDVSSYIAVFDITNDGIAIEGSPFTITGNDSFILERIALGEYVVTEQAISGFITTPADHVIIVTIDEENDVGTAAFTNSRSEVTPPPPPQLGNLVVTKIVSGVAVPEDYDATFTVSGPDGYSSTFTYAADFTDGSYTLVGLNPGDYTVTETSAPIIDGYAWSVSGSGNVTAVVANQTASVTITNIYTLPSPPPPPPPPPPPIQELDFPPVEVPLVETPEEVIVEEPEEVVEVEDVEEVEEVVVFVPIEDVDVPLGELPQTGLSMLYQILFMAGALLVGTGIIARYYIKKHNKIDNV